MKNFALIGAAGYIELAKARVRWYLSPDRSDLPESVAAAGKSTCRSLQRQAG